MKRNQAYLGKLCLREPKNIPLLTALFTLFFITPISWAYAQGRSAPADGPIPNALNIGDKVPDITIRNILNYPSGEASISDFAEKLLILDFGATFCAPCIKSISHLDSMQERFSGKLVVLPVSREKPERVKTFLGKRGWDMPFVAGDKSLYHYFPCQIIPHLVWIMNGRVRAITHSYYATAENLESVIEGKGIRLPVKSDLVTYDPFKPLLVNGNGGNGETLLYQSAVTGYIAGMGPSNNVTKNMVSITNSTVLGLYRKALEEDFHFFRYANRVVLELSPSLRSRVFYPSGSMEWSAAAHSWQAKNSYCYNLFLAGPNDYRKRMKRIMLNDLNRFFVVHLGITGRVEKRKRKCWVLSLEQDGTALQSAGGSAGYTNTGTKYRLRNKPFRVFVESLRFALRGSPLPLVDATGYVGQVDMEIDTGLGNLDALKGDLGKYNLSLTVGEREIDMLVISEVGEGQTVLWNLRASRPDRPH